MHAIRYIAGLLALVGGATLLWATVTPSTKNEQILKVKLEPFERDPNKFEFVGKEKAAVICIGKHTTFLGMYVYDTDGNCVAWDDLVAPKGKTYPDSLAVEWFPPQNATYKVEVVNFGGVPTEYELVAK